MGCVFRAIMARKCGAKPVIPQQKAGDPQQRPVGRLIQGTGQNDSRTCKVVHRSSSIYFLSCGANESVIF
jgi:hypothetical protein